MSTQSDHDCPDLYQGSLNKGDKLDLPQSGTLPNMPLSTLKRWLTRLFAKTPIQLILIVAFVSQLVVAVAIMGGLYLHSGQTVVNTLAQAWSGEVSARIEQHVQQYLEQPQLFHRMSAASVQAGVLNVGDLPTLGHYFWEQIQLSSRISSLYYGSENGEFVGVQRRETGQYVLWYADASTDFQRYTYRLDSRGDPAEAISIQAFDPRDRPWYAAAAQAGDVAWSTVYQFASMEYAPLGITTAQPVYRADRSMQGVLAADITLDQINTFLSQLSIGQSGFAVIAEPSGAIVATSSDAEFMTVGDRRRYLSESRSDLMRAIAPALLHAARSVNPYSDLVKWNNATYYIETASLQPGTGLDWQILVIIPEVDVVSQIQANARSALVISILALLMAILVGIGLAKWIARPIHRLTYAAYKLASDGLHVPLDQNLYGYSYETTELAKTFNFMVHELQTSYQELAIKNAELRRLDQLKNEFLANTSHELRTPLNGIIGLSESLIDGATGDLSRETRSNLELITASGRRLANLVDDLLDFSKLRYHQVQLQCTPIGLREIVEIVLSLSRPLVDNKPLVLVNAIAPDFPLVWADESRLQQILHNLVDNAIKFTDRGQVVITAALRSSNGAIAPSSQAAIYVSDTGIGIPAADHERIFEWFEQLDSSASRIYPGTGLGLAITKQLVELHGGTIHVQSQVSEGAQFCFTLPLATHASTAVSSPEPLPLTETDLFPAYSAQAEYNRTHLDSPSPSWTAPSASRPSPFQILIVDDEPINVQVLGNHLTLAHYAIAHASSGQDALDLIANGLHPDLILLDVMMPRMTGYEFCRQLRQQYPAYELPVVMLTARNQVSDLVEGMDAGANDYLTKPVSKPELLARIKTHIQLAKVNVAYSRFVPHEFLKLLGHDSIVDVRLGEQVQTEMTIMFADIRSFTRLAEQMSPEDSFRFLNAYLRRVGPIVRQHHGFIDKYIGDAVMALFPEHPEDALKAAIAMQMQVNEYNAERQAKGKQAIAVGIGLHTGQMMLGTVGEEQRMEGTVIADAVNLAARLERLTKLYGVGVLTSTATLNCLENVQIYQYRFLDRVQVRGKEELVSVWEFYQGDPPEQASLKSQTRTLFETGVCFYHLRELASARQAFMSVLQINPDDRAAQLYVQRCDRPWVPAIDGPPSASYIDPRDAE